jgi:type II secretory pathway component PulF
MWSAFSYPIVITGLAFVILGFIMYYVVGAHQKMFEEFELTLPMVTEVLFWWRDVGLYVIGGSLLVLLGIWALMRVVMSKAAWCRFVAGTPIFGRLWYWSGTAEWAGLMSVLVKNEVPMPEALRLAADGVSDAYVREMSHALAESVSRGRSVSQMLSSGNSLCASLGPLVRWGEDTGALGEAFDAGRDLLDRGVRTRALLLQTVLPPFLFIGIGSAVSFVVVSLFIPLINLVQGLS